MNFPSCSTGCRSRTAKRIRNRYNAYPARQAACAAGGLCARWACGSVGHMQEDGGRQLPLFSGSTWLKRLRGARPERLSLRTRIAISLAIALLPLCLAAEIAQYSEVARNGALQEKALITRGEAVLAGQSRALSSVGNLLDTISLLPLGNPVNRQLCNDMFRRMIVHNTDVSSIRLVAEGGNIVCQAPQQATATQAGATQAQAPEWFDRATRLQQFSIQSWHGTEAQASNDAGTQTLTTTQLIATRPLFDADGNATGILAATFAPATLAFSMQETKLPESSALAILDAHGALLAQQTNGAQLDEWLPQSLVADAGTDLMSGTFVQEGRDSVKRVYVVNALPGNIFGLYAQKPGEPSLAARAMLYFVIAFPLLVWIAASIMAGRASERMVIDPLNRVRQAIRRYIAGETSARVDEDADAPEEVQALARKFNAMAEIIQTRDDALRSALAHQKALVREINHRVRNNLQVMSSLLNLQSRRAQTPEQAAIFLDVQRRLNALGTVHNALYQGDDFQAIDLGVLLKDLCQSTARHLASEWGQPVLTMQCRMPVFALPDAALTLAFLVTELIAAATAHLSPEGHPAVQLDFELAEKADGGSVLTLKVDQPVLGGLMENRPDEGQINLFRGLIRQLRAHMEIGEDNCVASVTMPALV